VEEKKTTEAEEEVDIDLNDPEVAQAALKIQTGFRGHLARKEVNALKVCRSRSRIPSYRHTLDLILSVSKP
jgi:hypothetical protein